jgi:hypothetical protein
MPRPSYSSRFDHPNNIWQCPRISIILKTKKKNAFCCLDIRNVFLHPHIILSYRVLLAPAPYIEVPT